MTSDRASEAVTITQRILDTTGDALMSGEFEPLAECFRLPQSLGTVDGVVVMRTREDLRTVFDGIHAYLVRSGVDRLDRRIENAVFDGPDVIRYSFVSRYLKQNRLTQPPFTSHTVADRRNGCWGIVGTQYAIKDQPDHVSALQPRRLQAQALRDASKAARVGSTEALDIVQRVLDGITSAYLSQDFDALMPWVQLPFFMQSSESSVVHTKVEDLRAAFKRRVTMHLSRGIDDFVRLVKTADFIGDTRIHGTYRTHVLRDTQLVAPSYVSAMSLQQGEDRVWRATSIMHPMGYLALDRLAEREAT